MTLQTAIAMTKATMAVAVTVSTMATVTVTAAIATLWRTAGFHFYCRSSCRKIHRERRHC
jgi:hypothetical protein